MAVDVNIFIINIPKKEVFNIFLLFRYIWNKNIDIYCHVIDHLSAHIHNHHGKKKHHVTYKEFVRT